MKISRVSKSFHQSIVKSQSFAHIDDAEKVYHLMQQIQKETP